MPQQRLSGTRRSWPSRSTRGPMVTMAFDGRIEIAIRALKSAAAGEQISAETFCATPLMLAGLE